MSELNARQQKFVEHYAASGNSSEAARKAGYSAAVANRTGSRLLTNADIKKALNKLSQPAQDKRIADAQERKEWWTALLRGQAEGADWKDRLKASELLGKTAGDFKEIFEHTVVEKQVIDASALDPKKRDQLRAIIRSVRQEDDE